MKKTSLLVTSLCLSLALCSCGEESSSVPSESTSSESTSSESSLTENPITIVTRDNELAIGQTIALAYRVDGNLDVVFSSSNPEIATVDDYGQVSGVSEGTVTITVALADNPSVSASIELSVYKPFFLTEKGYINGTVDTRDARDGVVTIGGGQTQLLVNELGQDWYFSCHIVHNGYENNDPLGRFGLGSFWVDTLHPIGNNMFWYGLRPSGDGSSGVFTPYYGGWRYQTGITNHEDLVSTFEVKPGEGVDLTIMRHGQYHYFHMEQGDVKFGYAVEFFDNQDTFPGIYSQNQLLTITEFESSSDPEVVKNKLNEFQSAEEIAINGFDTRLQNGRTYQMSSTISPELTPIKDVTYNLVTPLEGVSLTPEGSLTIDPGVTGTFRVQAVASNNPNAKATVKYEAVAESTPSEGPYNENLLVGEAAIDGETVSFNGGSGYVPLSNPLGENQYAEVELNIASGTGRVGLLLGRHGYFQQDYAEFVIGSDNARTIEYGTLEESFLAPYARDGSNLYRTATLGLLNRDGRVYVYADGRLLKSFDASSNGDIYPVVYSEGVVASAKIVYVCSGVEAVENVLSAYPYYVGGYVETDSNGHSLMAYDFPGTDMNWPPMNDYQNGLKWREALKGELDISFTISSLIPMLSGSSYDSKILLYLQSESPTCSLQLVIKGTEQSPIYSLCPNFDDATWTEYPLADYGIDFSGEITFRVVKLVEGLEVYINGIRVLEDSDALLNDNYDWSNDSLSTPGLGTFRCGATVSEFSISAYQEA